MLPMWGLVLDDPQDGAEDSHCVIANAAPNPTAKVPEEVSHFNTNSLPYSQINDENASSFSTSASSFPFGSYSERSWSMPATHLGVGKCQSHAPEKSIQEQVEDRRGDPTRYQDRRRIEVENGNDLYSVEIRKSFSDFQRKSGVLQHPSSSLSFDVPSFGQGKIQKNGVCVEKGQRKGGEEENNKSQKVHSTRHHQLKRKKDHPHRIRHEEHHSSPTVSPPSSCSLHTASSSQIPGMIKTLKRSEVVALSTFRVWNEKRKEQVRYQEEGKMREKDGGAGNLQAAVPRDSSSCFLFSSMFSPSSVYSPASLLLQCIMDVYAPSLSSSALPSFSIPESHGKRRRQAEGEEDEGDEDEKKYPGSDSKYSCSGSSFLEEEDGRGKGLKDLSARRKRIEENAQRVAKWMIRHLSLLVCASERNHAEGSRNREDTDEDEEEEKKWRQGASARRGSPSEGYGGGSGAACLPAFRSATTFFAPLLLELIPFFIRLGVLGNIPVPPISLSLRKRERKRGKREVEGKRNEKKAGNHLSCIEHSDRVRTEMDSEVEDEEEECEIMERTKGRKIRRSREMEVPQWICAVFLHLLKELRVFSSPASCFPPPSRTAKTMCTREAFPTSSASPPPFHDGWYWIVIQEWATLIFSLSKRGNFITPDRKKGCASVSSSDEGDKARRNSKHVCDTPSLPLSSYSASSLSPHQKIVIPSQDLSWYFFPFFCVEYILTELCFHPSPSIPSFLSSSSLCSVRTSPLEHFSHHSARSFPHVCKKKEIEHQRRGIRKEEALMQQLLSPLPFMYSTADNPHGKSPSTIRSNAKAPSSASFFPSPPPPPRGSNPRLSACSTNYSTNARHPEEALLHLCFVLESHPDYPHLEELGSVCRTHHHHPSSPSSFSSFLPINDGEEMTDWSPLSLRGKDNSKEDMLLSVLQYSNPPYAGVSSFCSYYLQRMAKVWRTLNQNCLSHLLFFLPISVERSKQTCSLPPHHGVDLFHLINEEDGELETYRMLLLNSVVTSL